MIYQHLKDRPYYEDMYDRHTVEMCHRYEDPRPISEATLEAAKGDVSPAQNQWCHDLASDWILFQTSGDRYLKREDTIEQWMEKDRRRDEMLERTRMPPVSCPSCSKGMECIHKDVNFDIDSDREWVEFYLCCKPCKQGKDVYENGTEVPRNPILCIKCNREVETDTKKKNGKRYYIETCKHCGHIEETESAIGKKKDPTAEEIKRFEYDKQRFCLNDQQGHRYRHWVESMKQIESQTKEEEANTELYDKLADTKKINIASLEKLLKAITKKVGYADLQITMPSPGQQIIVEFSVRDTEEKREEYDSRKTLDKAIEKALDNKNWSLAEGVSYRLGLLSGRIRGYETEEELQKLTKARMKKSGKKLKSIPAPSGQKEFSY